MSAIRIVTVKEGIPLTIRDVEPFFTEWWSDTETGFEYVNEYYLVFDFREGLLVEIVQRLIGGGEFSWEVPLDQIGEEALMKLKESGRLEIMRDKVREVVQRLTENLDSLFFDPIGDRRRSCYVCGSDALHECIRCNKDVCDQHAVFAETEYEEPLTYCHECFWEAVEDDPY